MRPVGRDRDAAHRMLAIARDPHRQRDRLVEQPGESVHESGRDVLHDEYGCGKRGRKRTKKRGQGLRTACRGDRSGIAGLGAEPEGLELRRGLFDE